MIKILHLFPKLLNLYGDWGNIAVLSRALEGMGAEVSVTETEEPGSLDVSDFDFIYCGAGTENRIALAAEKLSVCRESFASAEQKGAVMLFTGSAMELACRNIVLGESTVQCLGLFDASVNRTADRQTGDVLYRSKLSDKLVAGFINKSGSISTECEPMFSPWFGPCSFEAGADGISAGEGLNRGNIFATYVTGPVLVRNPWLKKYFAELLFSRCVPGQTPSEYSDEYAEKGWEVTVSELEKRKNGAN